MWVAGRGGLSCPSIETAGTHAPVRRGRVADGSGCVGVLTQLARRQRDPIPAGPVVVVCRPVLATMAEQYALRRVATAVFAPSRVLFIDTVRAAAIGAGAAMGGLLIADIGAELSEVAVLQDGRVAAARRTDLGTRDLKRGTSTEVLAHATTGMIDEPLASTQAIASCDGRTPRAPASRSSAATRRWLRSPFSPANRGRWARMSRGPVGREPASRPRDSTP